MKVRLTEDVEILPGIVKRAGSILTSSRGSTLQNYVKEGRAVPLQSDLPEDFPKRKELLAGGYTNIEQIEDASDEDLLAVDGIGSKSVTDIRNYNSNSTDNEE